MMETESMTTIANEHRAPIKPNVRNIKQAWTQFIQANNIIDHPMAETMLDKQKTTQV